MATALDLIESAMSKIGMLAAGETVSAEDAAVGLLRLNSLVDALENENMFCYTTTKTVVSLSANTASLTIGPAMDIDMTRPVKLLRGSFCRVANIDYRLDPITEPEYNEITLKDSTTSNVPRVMFYDGGTPTGIVYFWPEAASTVSLHLLSPEPGGQAADTSTAYLFPPGYQRMLEFNLAVELAPDFNTQCPPWVMAEAANSKRLLKRTNATTPQLDMPNLSSPRDNSLADFYGGGA